MSGDMRKSFLLRCFLFAVASVALWIAVGFADAIYILIFNQLTGLRAGPKPIEVTFFVVVTSKIIWRWLARRVWIGSLPSTEGK